MVAHTKKAISLGIFAMVGSLAIVYDVIVIRPEKIQEREQHLLILAESKKTTLRCADGFKPTPPEQVYDAALGLEPASSIDQNQILARMCGGERQ